MRNKIDSSVIIKKPSRMVVLYMLPPIVKLLLAVLLFFMICVFGFMYLKKQAAADYAIAKQKKEIVEKEVVQSAQSYGQLSYLSKNTALAKQQYEAVLKKFPTESQIGDLLASITKLGTSEGLRFVSFKPSPTVINGFYAQAPVEVVVIGQFHQLARFLSGIANLPGSVVSVNQFSLTDQSDQNDLLKLELIATLYYTLPTSADIPA